MEDSSFNRPPPDEEVASDAAAFPTEPKVELTPPEPRPQRPTGLPPGLVQAVDRVLDALDAAAEAVRAAIRRVAQ